MSDLSANFRNFNSNRRMLRILAVFVFLSLFFAGGVFLSGLLDKRILALMSDVRLKIKQKYGVTTSVGQVETGFGVLRLSEVSVGDPAWVVIDRVDLAVSLNPFKGFLKPSSMTIGRAVVKIPINKEHWPKEVRSLVEALKRKAIQDGKRLDEPMGGGVSSVIPPRLIVNAAKVEIADGENPRFLGEGLSLDLELISKSLSFGAQRLRVPEWLEESFLEGEVNFAASESVSITALSRISPGESVVWTTSCELNRNLRFGNCQIDASHLPRSLVAPLHRWLGKSFAPSYQGSISLDRNTHGDGDSSFRLNIDGQVGDIFIENPSVAIGAVGPGFLNLKIDSEVSLAEKSMKILPSQIKIAASNLVKGQGVHQFIPLNLHGEVRLDSPAADKKVRASGFLNAEMPDVDCQTVLKAVPQSFVPDLSGFRMGGVSSFQIASSLVNSIPEIKIEKGSSFACDVLSAPEIYSASYLNGPFNIERSLPEQKIYIPVDPARPYFAAYNEIPAIVRSAFVSSEDAGFFQHKGVELSAIISALERNSEEGRAAVGGSTITMQTVKNLFLARDKTISRKVQEIFLAWHLDRILSKERVLEIYLNMVEFGPSLYGIGMASQRFFGVSHKDLTLKQAIYLASLLPAPVPRYRYFCKGELTPNYERLVRQLLDRMLGLGRITAAQHAEAVAEKIEFSRIERESACERPDYAGSEPEIEFEKNNP